MGQEKFQKSSWMLLSSYGYMLQGNARAKCQKWKWTRVIIWRWIPDLKLVWRNKSQCSGWRLLLGLTGLWSGSDRTDRQSLSVSGRTRLLVSLDSDPVWAQMLSWSCELSWATKVGLQQRNSSCSLSDAGYYVWDYVWKLTQSKEIQTKILVTLINTNTAHEQYSSLPPP